MSRMIAPWRSRARSRGRSAGEIFRPHLSGTVGVLQQRAHRRLHQRTGCPRQLVTQRPVLTLQLVHVTAPAVVGRRRRGGRQRRARQLRAPRLDLLQVHSLPPAVVRRARPSRLSHPLATPSQNDRVRPPDARLSDPPGVPPRCRLRHNRKVVGTCTHKPVGSTGKGGSRSTRRPKKFHSQGLTPQGTSTILPSLLARSVLPPQRPPCAAFAILGLWLCRGDLPLLRLARLLPRPAGLLGETCLLLL